MGQKPNVAVFHLVRALNGIAPFERFIASYREHPAGMQHRLVLILKGFTSKKAAAPWQDAVSGLDCHSLWIRDTGYDLHAYRTAALAIEADYLLFTNSFTEFLANEWLLKMYSALTTNGVGLVGATGSAESMFTNAQRDWEAAPEKTLRLLRRMLLCRICFPPWPNYHIRTNCFMMQRPLMLACWPRSIRTKQTAYLFENGRRSLTARVRHKGFRPLVVGKDGRTFAPEIWHASGTFRCGNQSNLLAADNQTRSFEKASAREKIRLAVAAWGKHSTQIRAVG